MNAESNSGQLENRSGVLDTAASGPAVNPEDGAAGFDPDRTMPNLLRPTVRRIALPAEANTSPAPDRAEDDLGAVTLITDRGIVHAHNEDAAAAAVVDDVSGLPLVTVIAVCDGVSSSRDPQAASGTASRTGVDACLAALAGNRSASQAAEAGLSAAAEAVCDLAAVDSDAPSCTYVSAIVLADGDGKVAITVANVGDSRAYWLAADTAPAGQAEAATPSQRLTVDDSWAQALIDAGAMDEQTAMNDPRAHTLMRWLGADAGLEPWSPGSVRTFQANGPGVLLLCTDGLWNYLPDPEALAPIATGKPPLAAARDLVDYAIARGGSDNITVALVPIVPLGSPQS